jgi:hypothetical protein
MAQQAQGASAPSQDQIREMYCDKRYSKLDIASLYGVSIRRVERWMSDAGIQTRSKKDAVHAALSKISAALKGKRKNITPEWRANIAAARNKWCEENAIGTSAKKGGYVEYTTGEHKGRGVHVVAMEQHLGRRLAPGEIVHHRDENKHNNSFDNLVLMTRSEHQKHHRAEQRESGGGNSKLTADQVRQIREAYAAGGTSYSKLAAEFGVNRSYIGAIVRGSAWK